MRKTVLVPIVLVALAAVACRPADPLAWPAGSARRVLLVTFDTTRADRIGAYGYAPAKTPTLDRLAADGLLFEQVVAPTPITLPSHASVMTGAEPFLHGVRDNGFVLSDDAVTLAEVFRDAGWRTAASVGSYVLDERFGMGQGFERFFAPKLPVSGNVRVERTASAVVADAQKALAEIGTEDPWFLWVHFFDPHHPFEAPIAYHAQGLDAYDAEISYADERLGALLDWIEREGHGDGLLVAVTADHGESLGEHGEESHGAFVYDSAIRVPLILSGAPLDGRPGTRVARRVLNSAVAPTLVRLAGLDPSPLRGDIPPLLGDTAEESALYIETLLPFYSFRWRASQGVIFRDHKLIVGAREELYDLANDPRELVDLSEARPELRDRMRERLDAILADAPEASPAGRDLDPEERARLEALGYVARQDTGDPFADDLPDPVERIGDIQRIAHALGLVESVLRAPRALGPGREPKPLDERSLATIHRARAILEDVLRENPDDPQIDPILGMSHALEGDHERAAEHFERAASRPDAIPTFHTNLATSWVKIGRVEDAERHMRDVIEREPKNFFLTKWMANHYARQDQPLRASWWLREMEEAIGEDPDARSQGRRWVLEVVRELRARGHERTQPSELPEAEPEGV